MSAALSSLIPGLRPAPVVGELGSAVDPLDAAARLEAAGLGDIAAARDGFRDVFEQARMQFSPAVPHRASATCSLSLGAGMWRAVVLVSGVLICLAALGPVASPYESFVAGAVGWLAVQTASVILWWGQGRNYPSQAARVVVRGMAGVLGLAIALSAWWGDAAVAVWALWGWVAAVGVCLVPGWRLGLACLGGAGLAWLGTLLPGTAWDTVAADVLVVVAAGFALAFVLKRAGGERQPTEGLAAALSWGLVCLVSQLLGIALVYFALGEHFVLVAIGAIVASAASEPVLDLVSYWSRRVAARCSSWRTARTATTTVGVAGVMLVGGVSLAVVWLCSFWWERPLGGRTLIAALLVSAVSCGIGYASRLGSGPGAAGTAALGTLLIAVALFIPVPARSPAGMTIAAVALIAAMMVASVRLASPRAW